MVLVQRLITKTLLPTIHLHAEPSRRCFSRLKKSRIDILRGFEGEMLLVLERPGSGCTTLLRTLAGHTHGLYVDKDSKFNYQGKAFKNSTSAISMLLSA